MWYGVSQSPSSVETLSLDRESSPVDDLLVYFCSPATLCIRAITRYSALLSCVHDGEQSEQVL